MRGSRPLPVRDLTLDYRGDEQKAEISFTYMKLKRNIFLTFMQINVNL
jgi:hypothetical protein